MWCVLLPPLNVSDDEISEAVERLEKAATQVAAQV
jgi:acetylornithine/N-succinyldiaminopimelate aminotransferase